jgi:hypothetical protein
MLRSIGIRFACGVLLLVPLGSVCAGEPSRVELAKRGKAATVMVEVTGRSSYGSGFCVHPSGLFLTSEKVIRAGAGKGVSLILQPGLKGQRVLPAKVVRGDADLDLALLSVEGEKDLPALELGTDEHLTELGELIEFGFPFVHGLVSDKSNSPAIHVMVRKIMAVQRKNGMLLRVQLDGTMNNGYWGGPFLDKTGRVAGMAAMELQGGNYALPASRLRRFVSRPEILFTPPELRAANLHKPTLFRVQALPVLPSAKTLEVELYLGSGPGAETKYPMRLTGDVHEVSAPPVPAGPESGLRATIDFADSSVIGHVADQRFKVGDKELPLSEVSRLLFAPKPQVDLHDGSQLTGAITGLSAAVVHCGQEKLTMDLSKALDVRLEKPVVIRAIQYTIVVREAGNEVARQSKRIPVSGPVVGFGPPPAIQAPPMDKGALVAPLPSAASDVTVGKGGRYLIFHLPKENSLAVFDISKAKVIHSIAVSEKDVRFAAGRDKLVVVLPRDRVIQRYSLTTFQRELVVPLPFPGDYGAVAMGAASDGPIFMGGAVNKNLPVFLELHTLKPFNVTGLQPIHADPSVQVRASAQGNMFAIYRVGTLGVQMLHLNGTDATAYGTQEGFQHVVPGADGQLAYTNNGLFTTQLRPTTTGRTYGRFCFPAASGLFYVGFRGGEIQLSLHIVGEDKPLATIGGSELNLDALWKSSSAIKIDKRFHFHPNVNMLAFIPASNDRVVYYRVDAEQALQKSGVDFFVVSPGTPPAVKRGQVFTYQVGAKSRKGGLKYRLELGPKGMELSSGGQLRWTVPADFADQQSMVIVSIRNAADEERFAIYRLEIRK